jgi:hypothetical protein
MKMILLTAEQAEHVRGNYGRFSALEPIQVVEGWCLPPDVIDNPEFQSIKEYLQTLPIVEVTFIQEIIPDIDENIQ